MTDWELVIGLEVHCELRTETKLFCSCRNAFGDEPNTNVCPVCLGLPGSLPVLNRNAVEYAMRIGEALHCSIEPSIFHRKNYFYPDMPKDYQTSQYDQPINVDGWLELPSGKRVGIERAHLEEDTGKTTHIGGGGGRIHGADHSLVDYNRAGVPLVEIVSRPDLRSSEDAKAYVAELRAILVATGASDGKMEEGSLRVDANVSVRPGPDAPFGTRCEIKNMNSLRSLGRAIEYEARRQIDLLEAGERVVQETRHWSEDEGRTSSMRSKEEAFDYRYFPEPDLVPVAPDAAWVEELRAALPEPPSARRKRLVEQLGLSDLDAQAMVNAGVLGLVLETVEAGASATEARNWWLGTLAQKANESGVEAAELAITPAQVARVCALVAEGTLNAGLARQVVEGVLAGEGDPDAVVAARGLAIVSDEGALLEAVREAIAAAPDVADKVRGGKVQAVGALLGPVMRSTGGKADPGVVRRLVLAELGVEDA
jgi:aspartyl-tRNA(Asn)/glutamyl-tRNA(Gln) amidotransferase subunit B